MDICLRPFDRVFAAGTKHIGIGTGVYIEVVPWSGNSDYSHVACVMNGRELVRTRRPVRISAIRGYLAKWLDGCFVPTLWTESASEGEETSDWLARYTAPTINHSGSVVYFMASDRLGLVKIGWAVSASKRMAQLGQLSPTPLRLIKATLATAIWSAGSRRFRRFRHHGEWFVMAPELLDFIASTEEAR